MQTMSLPPSAAKGFCLFSLIAATALANAGKWTTASGTVSVNGDEAILTGSTGVARADIRNIPVLVRAEPVGSPGPRSDPVDPRSPCNGTYILCDDFNSGSIDSSVWMVGNLEIAHKYPVRTGNVSLARYNDNGTSISVVDAKIYGDLHADAPRQGGLLITKKLFDGARYEVRMKNLPGPHGCSCIWNYYDSDNEFSPPATRVYTEIDIEMPAQAKPVPPWTTWKRTLGLNTWSHTDSNADATYINHTSPTVDPFDGEFHVFRWDWYDGKNGTERIDWYIDDIFQSSTTQHVSNHPAQLWVGNWPAPWLGMDYNFDTLHMYIDWVRISELK